MPWTIVEPTDQQWLPRVRSGDHIWSTELNSFVFVETAWHVVPGLGYGADAVGRMYLREEWPARRGRTKLRKPFACFVREDGTNAIGETILRPAEWAEPRPYGTYRAATPEETEEFWRDFHLHSSTTMRLPYEDIRLVDGPAAVVPSYIQTPGRPVRRLRKPD